MATDTPVLELKRISEDIYTAAPTSQNVTHNDQGPRVILIFGWMEAQVSHTKKYMDSYAKLYPHASQILVRSRQSFWWTGKTRKEATLSPVIDVLRAEGMFQAPVPSMLIHVFSNGGAFQLLELSRMLQSGQISNTPTTTAIIYDSLPGKLELGPALAAFLAPIRSLFFRALMSIPLTIIYYVLSAIALIRRQRPIFDQMREELNQARILPWTDQKTPRLYIYSDTDKMVQQRAVEEHIAEARRLGFNIRAEYFKGSSHVSHVRLDADRYWAAVKDIWEEAANN